MPQAFINGYSMHYTDCGQGTTIIFIHPPVLTSLNFLYQMKPLSADFRTISFDIRGHGSSKSSREEITYPLIVEDIRQLMDQLKIEKAFLCGYSTGGSIVLDFLLTCPERAFGGIVISGMSEVNDKKLRNKIARGRFLSRIGAIGAIALSISWSQAKARLSLFRTLFTGAKRANAENAEQYYHYSMQYNCTAQLDRIHHPVLLVYGEKDTLFHPYAKLLQERLPKSELVFIKKTKHQIPTKAAGKVNGLIRQFIHRYESSSPKG
ncbi:alpha/beta fold hydrolase [Paenibacillus riograndensis]|uniref:Alpha/beta hydrolase n=1 Tax=Paenibacillus riograndensis SBR5 TaxID=1073571 RepID=A0A0E3WI09_9BACL|nr:alpha/beta hydrolase [Paenibacillus riograndensis]CQR56218.1 alpha/beta hydrolase [Paenibacillus riograndensis SBR5]